jgi:hypothetical protein
LVEHCAGREICPNVDDQDFALVGDRGEFTEP